MGELVGWALAGPGGLVKTSRIVTCVSTLAHEKCHKNETQRVGRVFVTTHDLVVIWGVMDPMLVFLFLDSQICRPQNSVSNVAVWLVWSQGAIKTQKLA